MSDEYPIIADFGCRIRRPTPLQNGMTAQLFAANGPDADAVVELARTKYLDSRVDVTVWIDGAEAGGFQGYLRRPKSLLSGMVAQVFGENGQDSDMITVLCLSKFYDREARVVVRRIQDAEGRDLKRPEKREHPFGQLAVSLKRSGFFRIPAIWKAIGTDDEFRAWVQRQPSARSGKFNEYVHGEGRCIAAHVRRAGESGVAYKGEYACIPLTQLDEHEIQHRQGESAVGGREWFDAQRIKYVEKWAWETLREALGYESMGDVPPSKLRAWALEKGIAIHLPAAYREAS